MKLFRKLGIKLTMLLAIVFMVAVLILGWRVWRADPPPNNNGYIQLPNTYVDSAKRFSFNFPSDWTVFYLERGGTDGPTDPEPDWTTVSRPVLIEPRDSQTNDIVVNPGCSAGTIAEFKANTDKFHTQQDLTINSYGAFYDRLEFKGDAESYLDHIYVVLGPTDCLQFRYREYHHHPMSNTDFDDKANVPTFQAIVNSVRFVK